jgi:hypothetical protein
MMTWTDVPDPRDDTNPCVARCEVTVEERTWRHIAEGHVVPGGEPWDEWLSPALAGRYRRLWSPGNTPGDRENTLAEVGVIVEGEMKRCLAVPLGVVYDDYQPPLASGGPSRPQETWGLVLPSGAFLVVRSRPAGGEVRTCYFKGIACRTSDPAQRWRRVAENVLLTYAKVQPDRTFVPPAPLDMFEADGGIRLRVRFRTVASWSLDGTQVRPWDAIPAPWKTPTPVAPPALTLRPRRSY